MKVVKIVQDSETGKVGIRIEQDEKYDIEEHLQVLMEFATEKAIGTHELMKSHEKLVTRLDECEKKLSEVIEKIKVD